MMKTRNRFSSALMLGALVVGLVIVAAVWNAIPVRAIREVERPQFGVISLAAGQTARLNVANTRAIDPEDATAGDGSVRKVTLAFDVYAPATSTDDGGSGRAASCLSKQRFLRRESCEVTLRPGEAASLDFTAPEGTRVRAAVAYGTPDTRGGNRRAGDPNLRTTLEVQEGGRTSFVHSPEAVFLKEVDG
ncbi:MAG: hypothetical protein LC802_18315 [Acidobacteria bacterium]|nr:hypothetical protein [Acidobacteriota bacterium]